MTFPERGYWKYGLLCFHLFVFQQIAAGVKKEQDERREISPVSSQSDEAVSIDGITDIENSITDKTDVKIDPNSTFINIPLGKMSCHITVMLSQVQWSLLRSSSL